MQLVLLRRAPAFSFISAAPGAASTRRDSIRSQLLSHFLEIVTLNDVTNFVFGKVAEFDPTLDTSSHLFHVVLESAQCRDTAIINRLPATQNSGSPCAGNSAVCDEAAGDSSLCKLENLPDLCMADNAFPNFRIEHPDHGFFHLVDEFVDDAIQLDLDAFPFRRGSSLILYLDVKTDDHRVRGGRQQDI